MKACWQAEKRRRDFSDRLGGGEGQAFFPLLLLCVGVLVPTKNVPCLPWVYVEEEAWKRTFAQLEPLPGRRRARRQHEIYDRRKKEYKGVEKEPERPASH